MAILPYCNTCVARACSDYTTGTKNRDLVVREDIPTVNTHMSSKWYYIEYARAARVLFSVAYRVVPEIVMV